MVINRRPETGPGHYLRDAVYGALDGVVTTLAILAGVAGAALAPRVAFILGLANLAADGFSMGASNYLGIKSELEQTGGSVSEEQPLRHAFATFIAFVIAGIFPLIAYLAPPADTGARVVAAGSVAGIVLFVTGALRARFLDRSSIRCGLEMLAIGTLAGAVAYLIGAGAHRLLTP